MEGVHGRQFDLQYISLPRFYFLVCVLKPKLLGEFDTGRDAGRMYEIAGDLDGVFLVAHLRRLSTSMPKWWVNTDLMSAPGWYNDHLTCYLRDNEWADAGVALQFRKIIIGQEHFLLMYMAPMLAPSAFLAMCLQPNGQIG